MHVQDDEIHVEYMETHVHSTPAKKRKRRKEVSDTPPQTNTQMHPSKSQIQHTTHTKEQDTGCPALRTGTVG